MGLSVVGLLLVSIAASSAFLPSPALFGSGYGHSVRQSSVTKGRLGSVNRLPERVRAAPCNLQMTHGGKHLTAAQKAELVKTAKAMCQSGKGLTATDEGPGTVGDRFEKVGITNTEENRRLYRQMLYAVPNGPKYLSGAILDPETVYQKNDDGVPFPEMLTKLGIVPGVKPHLKVYQLPGCAPGETVMQGLDSLAARCKEYYKAGIRFAKWRSPLVITNHGMSDLAIRTNMDDLARYALICQSEGLMPIVEPDISMSGDHDLETAIEINVRVQAHLYKSMIDHGVYLEGSTLKPNMVMPGKACPKPYTVEEIAEANIVMLRRVFPVAMLGANYLSGGQSLEDGAARLSAINQAKGNSPWNLSFSWSQALQLPLLELCKKNPKGSPLPLQEMSALLAKELEIAGAAARGEHKWKAGEGDHRPKAASPAAKTPVGV